MQYNKEEILISLVSAQSDLVLFENLPNAIKKSFGLVSTLTKTKTIYLYANSECYQGKLCSSQLYEYTDYNNNLRVNNPKLQNIEYDDSTTRWLKLFLENKNVEGYIEDFPLNEQKSLKVNNVDSIISMPIFINKKLWGFVGLENIDRQIILDEFIKDALKLFFTSLTKTIINYQKCKDVAQNEKVYEILYQKSYDAIFLIKNYKLIDVNETTKKMFEGKYKDDFSKNTGLNPFIMSPEFQENSQNSADASMRWMKECLDKGHSNFEWNFSRFDRTLFWADVALTRIHIDNHIYIHGSLREITKKKEQDELIKQEGAELRLLSKSLQAKVKSEVEKNREKDRLMYSQAKNAQMGEMLNMIAHQWRQPLNAMSASSIKITMKQELDLLDEEDINKHAEFIQTQTQKMSKVIDDFMNFFKPENEKTDFTIKECFADIEAIMGAQLIARDISLEYDKDSPYILHSYPKELSHVLVNLIANSRDAFADVEQKNQKISVDIVSLEDGVCLLRVQDNAGGISKDKIDKIFNPYFTTKEQGKGTGIGLYMSKRVVEEVLEGSISSQNTKDGVKFDISFKA